MKSNFKYYDRDQQMRLIGLRIHNNCMKATIRDWDELKKSQQLLLVQYKCQSRMRELQKKKLNFFQNIFEFFTDRRWFIIQNRIIKVGEENVKIAIKIDKLTLLARHNYKQSKLLK